MPREVRHADLPGGAPAGPAADPAAAVHQPQTSPHSRAAHRGHGVRLLGARARRLRLLGQRQKAQRRRLRSVQLRGDLLLHPSPRPGGEVYCIYCGECSLFVICLSVCLSVRSRKSNAFELRQVLCMLPMAVARSSSDGVAIRYVLPVLWMCFHIVEPMSENRVQHYFSKLR